MFGRERISGRPRIERLWRKELTWYEVPLWACLTPAAMVYGGTMAIRSAFWRVPGLRRRARNLKLISVGNLTVGGNGKTPFTLFLANKLAENGWQVGIVSRGYQGSKGEGPAALVSDGLEIRLDAKQAGDEPVMLAKSFAGPVAIAKRRIDGIRLLQQEFGLDAVVLDDGFQHVRLKRDVNLLLVNFERGFGNGWTLPAGPLRERISAAGRAHSVVLLTTSHGEERGLSENELRQLSRYNMIGALLRPRALVQPEKGEWKEAPLATLGTRRVMALSGLADPSGFYRMLRELDAELVGVLEYPDHYDYTLADWQSIMRSARNAELLITTEKDLVKLEKFPFARDTLFALRLEVSLGENEGRLMEMIMGADYYSGPAERIA